MDILRLQMQIIDTDLQIQTIDESHRKYVSDQLRHLNTLAGTFPRLHRTRRREYIRHFTFGHFGYSGL
jgi:hypothetical protein